MSHVPAIIGKLNQAIQMATPLTLSVSEMVELASFVNRNIEMVVEHSAMLNLYVEKQQGQVSYRVH